MNVNKAMFETGAKANDKSFDEFFKGLYIKNHNSVVE